MKWIFHECEARMIYSLTTDRQAVIYWPIKHLLERLYFDSYTQEKTKDKLSFRYCLFSAITRQEICHTIINDKPVIVSIVSKFIIDNIPRTNYPGS